MHSGRSLFRGGAASLLAFALYHSTPALAVGPLDGTWSQSAITETYNVLRWSKSCGPPPSAATLVPPGTVTITADGDELLLSGPGTRTFRTNQCLDPLSTLSRDAHTRDPSGKQWRTRCTTPQGDPRHAQMNSLVVATTDAHIDLRETGRYDGASNDGKCVADVTRTGALNLIARATAPAPAPTESPVAVAAPTPPAAQHAPKRPAGDCGSPGEPARLEVRPSGKLIRSGDAFKFESSVLDAHGCPTRASVRWSILLRGGAGPAPSIDANGRGVAAQDAPKGEFDVIASVGQQSATASLQISPANQYEELLAQSGLDPSGERDEPAVTLIPPGKVGSAGGESSDGATRKKVFIGTIGSLCLLLAGVGVFGARRARKAARIAKDAAERHEALLREHDERRHAREAEHDAQMRAHLESLARAKDAAEAMRARGVKNDAKATCPTCRRDFPQTSTFCPHDGSRLAHAAPPIEKRPAGMVCPVCRRGFEPGVRFCPDHREELIPYGMAAASSTVAFSPPAPRVKICPRCGSRSEGPGAFCGNDGTALVPLN